MSFTLELFYGLPETANHNRNASLNLVCEEILHRPSAAGVVQPLTFEIKHQPMLREWVRARRVTNASSLQVIHQLFYASPRDRHLRSDFGIQIFMEPGPCSAKCFSRVPNKARNVSGFDHRVCQYYKGCT